MRLVQLIRRMQRRVGLVDASHLRLIEPSFPSIYALAQKAIAEHTPLTSLTASLVSNDSVDYEAAWEARTEWRFLPSFDHPLDSAHCLVAGTGLTHKGSAANRAAMHQKANAELTDSDRMFQLGVEGGNPLPGQIGVPPEWFYKGDGSILKGHLDPLTVPVYGEDGGEEPEIAGAYLISAGGQPVRVGLTVGNEFSDHRMEKKNYLYLAPSKLRECSIGPELSIANPPFENVSGRVSVSRNNAPLWSSTIHTGQTNMSHSVANLEHHHFKYAAHRRPGDVHIHFFGADAFSFGAGIALESGDAMEVSFPDFGRPLRNTLAVEPKPEPLVSVHFIHS